jgi:hypothetical protein
MTGETNRLKPGQPSATGQILLGPGGGLSIQFRITQAVFPDPLKIAYGFTGENLTIDKVTSFKGIGLEIVEEKLSVQDLPKKANAWTIGSQNIGKTTASRVTLWQVKGGSTEDLQLAFFVVSPGFQIDTDKPGRLIWIPQS